MGTKRRKSPRGTILVDGQIIEVVVDQAGYAYDEEYCYQTDNTGHWRKIPRHKCPDDVGRARFAKRNSKHSKPVR